VKRQLWAEAGTMKKEVGVQVVQSVEAISNDLIILKFNLNLNKYEFLHAKK
jgi:hypothetical protein